MTGTITPELLVDEEIPDHSYPNVKKKIYNETINTPHVLHFALNNPLFENQIDNSRDTLYDEESFLLETMLEYLKNIDDSSTWYNTQIDYPENCIAFDFYVFDDKKNKNDIHTTAIWKHSPALYYIIDPNTNRFSINICKLLNIYFNNSFKMYGIFEIPTVAKDLAPNITEIRDCTDLAIKLCLSINELHKKYIIDDIVTNLLFYFTTRSKSMIDNHNDNYKNAYKFMFDQQYFKEQHSSSNDIRLKFINVVQKTLSIKDILPSKQKPKLKTNVTLNEFENLLLAYQHFADILNVFSDSLKIKIEREK